MTYIYYYLFTLNVILPFVQSKTENSFSSFSEQPQDYHSIIKFVDEQNSHDVKNNLNVEIVQKAFKEYKDDINQSLSDLDTKVILFEGFELCFLLYFI